jgi:hypothetical protein
MKCLLTCVSTLVLLITSQTASGDKLFRLGDKKRGVVSDFAVVNLAVKNSVVPFSRPRSDNDARRDIPNHRISSFLELL